MVREALTFEALMALDPREAAALFVARRAEGLTSSEQQLLERWLARDESHRRLFANADRSWQTFEQADGDEILQAMRAHARASQRRAPRWRPAVAAAAVLVVALGAWVFFPSLHPGASRVPGDPAVLATIAYASARGEVKELQLPDGSTMTLDADSRATGHFDASRRSVQLERGRAYFSIRPDKNRPFVANAAQRSIVVVGTRFDVNVLTDGLTITVLEGVVQVGHDDATQQPVKLMPGQQYVEHAGRTTIRNVGAAADNAVAWREGLVYLDDQTLADAVAIMNRYSRVPILIDSQEVAALRVSGQFRAGDAERFADTLADMHHLDAVQDGSSIRLVPRK